MKKFYSLGFLFLFSVVFALPITYQGKLTDFAGIGMNDTIDVSLAIYDDAWGGTLIDADTISGVIVEKGLFSAIFDLESSVSPLTTQLYYQVGINDGTGWQVLSPRQKVTANFASMWANKADWAADARHADYADSTVVIVSTTYADVAGFAVNANSADYATFADSARVSDTAHFADVAGFTVNSDTANYAAFADSTRIAAFADSAGAVTWDMLSNYFMTINDTAFHQIVVSDTFKYLTFVTDTLLSFYKINSGGQTGVYIEQFGHPSLPLFFAIYDSATTRGIIYAAGDTIAIIDPVQTDDGYALLFNNDTLVNAGYNSSASIFTIISSGDTVLSIDPVRTADGYALLFNGDTILTIDVINDSLGIGVSVDSDTVFYLDYDSLMVDLFGTDDIWGALSDTLDSYSDSLMSEMSDSMDAFRSELSDTLSNRFIGGAGTIPSGSPSVVINEPNVTSTSIIMVTLDCTSGTNAGFNVPVAILNITDGVSFTVGTADGSNVPADLSFEYIIFKP